MSTAGRTAPDDGPSASDVAATLRDAPFVHVVAAPDGDALAAAGLLARACEASRVPFQVSVARTDAAIAARLDGRDDKTAAVVVGADPTGTDAVACLRGTDAPASAAAYEVAEAMDASPDPTLALAGAIAGEREPGTGGTDRLLERATEAGRIERRPGVAVPTDDLADGLAHSTLLHAPFSGNVEAAQADLAELGLPADLDADAHRRVASMVALETTGDADATPRAADAVQRALHPYATPDGPFATLGGYADVLVAVARERPGAGVALALGRGDREEALDAWREHAKAAHDALRTATTGRYDGAFVARIDEGPVETVARLLADFRSPEPTALVVGDDEAAAATTGESDVAAALAAAVEAVGGEAGGTPRAGYARYDGEATEFINAVREEL